MPEVLRVEKSWGFVAWKQLRCFLSQSATQDALVGLKNWNDMYTVQYRLHTDVKQVGRDGHSLGSTRDLKHSGCIANLYIIAIRFC